MSWTYSGNPADSSKDLIRFLLGETVQSVASVSDEEIAYSVSLRSDGNMYRVASECADRMANRFAQNASLMTKVGDLEIQTDYINQSKHYKDLAKELFHGRAKYDVGAPVFFDTYQNVFSLGMTDYVGNIGTQVAPDNDAR